MCSFGQNHELQYLEKLCYVKSGLVEQLSSQYFSLGTLSNDDDDGSENFAKKNKFAFFQT